MTPRIPRYSKEEHARRGTEIYEQRVRPLVEQDQQGRIVAIDVETGEFELGDRTIESANRLVARLPDAQIWFVRVGHDYVHRLGRGGRRGNT